MRDIEPPVATPGEVVVDVERVGVCGTDVELFTGEMSYLHTGRSWYPLRPGHEWCGVVTALGDGVAAEWLGRRVTGDTMLGCGRCARCRAGRHHVCAELAEIGISRGRPGALAEQLAVPVTALHPLPDTVDPTLGALAEPGGNALRAVEAAGLQPGERLLILGTGTIGLLAALFARAQGIEAHLLCRDQEALRLAQPLGLATAAVRAGSSARADAHPASAGVWTRASLPELPWHAVVDASNAPGLPGLALELVEPARRVVLIGLAGTPSTLDTRDLVLKDVTAVGILGGSAGLAGAIAAYADGSVDARPLVAVTAGLAETVGILAGRRPAGAGPGPKIHIDPRR
ncbi:alcohol dehydrogenase catalytic domain-containing protein [Nonomuraea rosea]|uniref:Alcohol dehydrogenase catalytic domain-containing protein n=1 Tax=Nonomuraea rosea TaxID=638574 RepID=A0ABP6YVZ4_9ACTN